MTPVPVYSRFKMDLRYFIVAVTLFLSIQSSSQAQSSNPPLDSYISVDGGVGTVFVSLPDSTSISEIEVALGSKNSSTDIFTHKYTFDQSSGLPPGLSYSREGTNVYLGIGSPDFPSAYTAKVRLKNSGGTWSSWLEYVSN